MQTLSPSEHLQAPVQVRFPFRQEQLKVVQPLLQLHWTMSLHVFGTSGSVESLATRYPLPTFQPKLVDGGISGLALSDWPTDEGLIMGSFNVSMQSIWSGRHYLERLTLVKQLHSGVICLCHVLNMVQLTDELFSIVNLGGCGVSFSEVLK